MSRRGQGKVKADLHKTLEAGRFPGTKMFSAGLGQGKVKATQAQPQLQLRFGGF